MRAYLSTHGPVWGQASDRGSHRRNCHTIVAECGGGMRECWLQRAIRLTIVVWMLAPIPAAKAQDQVHDGNWWMKQGPDFQRGFLDGYLVCRSDDLGLRRLILARRRPPETGLSGGLFSVFAERQGALSRQRRTIRQAHHQVVRRGPRRPDERKDPKRSVSISAQVVWCVGRPEHTFALQGRGRNQPRIQSWVTSQPNHAEPWRGEAVKYCEARCTALPGLETWNGLRTRSPGFTRG